MADSRTITLSVTVPAALCLMLISAAAPAGDYAATFEAIDQNGDGYISSEEASARPDLAENWKTIDQNGDDRLTITEFSAFEGKGKFTPPEESEEPGIGAAPY